MEICSPLSSEPEDPLSLVPARSAELGPEAGMTSHLDLTPRALILTPGVSGSGGQHGRHVGGRESQHAMSPAAYF